MDIDKAIDWTESNVYKIGDVVKFGEVVYKCIVEHQAIVTLVPQFWELIQEFQTPIVVKTPEKKVVKMFTE